MQLTSFQKDKRKGKIGEQLFTTFLTQNAIRFIDVSEQHTDIDFFIYLSGRWSAVDVKHTYRDNGLLVIEEYSDILHKKPGWFYSSTADWLVFTSLFGAVFLRLHSDLKERYSVIKSQYELRYNKPSIAAGNVWQSAYRIVPLADLSPWGISILWKK